MPMLSSKYFNHGKKSLAYYVTGLYVAAAETRRVSRVRTE